jgi:cell division cycle protein 20 (cofactor of APC complex)
MPLTPSPRTRVTSAATNISGTTSPSTPLRKDQSIHKSDPSTFFSRSVSRSVSRFAYANSPKSNIAKGRQSPKQLDLGVSEWTLTGTGPATSSTPSKEKSRKETVLRSRPGKTTIRLPHNAADRFIPNRTASTGLATVGAGKADENTRPRTAGAEGSTVLANAASAFDISARGADADITNALENLGLEDETTTSSYIRSNADSDAYESSLATACGISTKQRILEFKPAPPESSKPIDLRSQYNRPLKQANTQSAQFRRRIQTAPERVLDAPGLVDDYYLNLLDWSSGN